MIIHLLLYSYVRSLQQLNVASRSPSQVLTTNNAVSFRWVNDFQFTVGSNKATKIYHTKTLIRACSKMFMLNRGMKKRQNYSENIFGKDIYKTLNYIN